MTDEKVTHPDNNISIKDTLASELHDVLLDVQHMSDNLEDLSATPAAKPVQPSTKKPEVEPKKIPEENPGIVPGNEDGDDQDEGKNPPFIQP